MNGRSHHTNDWCLSYHTDTLTHHPLHISKRIVSICEVLHFIPRVEPLYKDTSELRFHCKLVVLYCLHCMGVHSRNHTHTHARTHTHTHTHTHTRTHTHTHTHARNTQHAHCRPATGAPRSTRFTEMCSTRRERGSVISLAPGTRPCSVGRRTERPPASGMQVLVLSGWYRVIPSGNGTGV